MSSVDSKAFIESLTGQAAFDMYVKIVSEWEGYPGSEWAAETASLIHRRKVAFEYPKLTAAAKAFAREYEPEFFEP